MAVNKVVYGGTTLIDLTDTTATADTILSGYGAYGNDGVWIDGTATSGDTVSWFGAVNPTLLYETSASYVLSEMNNFSSITPSTSTQYVKYNSTTYSSSAATYVIYDRWGKNYNSGSALDFSSYDYVVLSDAMCDIAYTSTESSLGIAHSIKTMQTGIIWIGQRIRSSSGNLVYPTSSTYGTTIAQSYSMSGCTYRNSSNTFSFNTTSGYGLGITWVTPSFQTSSSLTCTYLNFRTPYWIVRTNSTYMASGAWSYVDSENTTLAIRQRLYQVDKPNVLEQGFNRLGYMIDNGAFPSEEI